MRRSWYILIKLFILAELPFNKAVNKGQSVGRFQLAVFSFIWLLLITVTVGGQMCQNEDKNKQK